MSSNEKQPGNEPVNITHEELEEFKRDMRTARLNAWARENQNNIIAAVLAVLLLIVGVSMWNEHRDSQRASAAAIYYQALNTQAVEDKRTLLESIIKDYDNTAYGGLARLLLAAADPEHAEVWLNELLERSELDAGMRTQARLDLARLKLNAGDTAAANKLLATPAPADYEQLRHYLLAEAGDNDADRIAHLKQARDAVSNDADLSRRIEQQLASLEGKTAGQD